MKKFIVQFRLKPGGQTKVMDVFEKAGPNRFPGVSFRDAWVGTREELIFVLCESRDESLVEQACQKWREYGNCEVHPVIQHEQY